MKLKSELEHLPILKEDHIGHFYPFTDVKEIGELWENSEFYLVYIPGVVRGDKNLLIYSEYRTDSSSVFTKGKEIDEKVRYRKISEQLFVK